jgi:hypothetical protein
MPSVEEKTQRPRIGNTFFIIGVIEHYKTLPLPGQMTGWRLSNKPLTLSLSPYQGEREANL